MSPEPWNDARARLEAAQLVDAARVAWPNEQFTPPATDTFLVVEGEGDILAPRELGPEAVWVEQGRLWVHVMVPRGFGSDDARTLAKAVANTFRGLPPGPMIYYDATIGPGGATDPDGRWWRLSVSVDWRYQDAPT